MRNALAFGYGLLIYLTVRLLNDTVAGVRFWERPWYLNALELVLSGLVGIGQVAALDYLRRRAECSPQTQSVGRQLTGELARLAALTLLAVNLTFTPLAALTDDGLSWGDVALINVVPLLYALLYYGVVRSQGLLRAYVDSRVRLERVQQDQLQTELKFLRAQYHPHFLFNALNTVYFQMDDDVAAAKHSLELLSELLRYQLYDQRQTVPVRQELHYLQAYLELQRVRASSRLQLTVDLDPRLDQQRVYPLLLLPLVENAFKYVGGAWQLSIRAELTPANELRFVVTNAVPPALPAPPPDKPGGIGLDNLRRRLALLYPHQHTFHAALHSTDSTFVAELAVLLG